VVRDSATMADAPTTASSAPDGIDADAELNLLNVSAVLNMSKQIHALDQKQPENRPKQRSLSFGRRIRRQGAPQGGEESAVSIGTRLRRSLSFDRAPRKPGDASASGSTSTVGKLVRSLSFSRRKKSVEWSSADASADEATSIAAAEDSGGDVVSGKS
jgi:hypothetical protein